MKNVKYISASAGSGKTYSLTKALTEAIQKGDVEPENVILTTFTKAAASEFKEKAKAMLYENGLIMEAARLDQALIGTIHSVAESMILRYWYILGLSPKISPIAEEDLEFFKNQSMINILSPKELSFLNDFAEEFNIRQERSSKINYDFWKKDLSQILEYATNYDIKNFDSSIDYSKNLAKSLLHGGYHIKINKELIIEYLNKAESINKGCESDKQEEIQIAIKNLLRELQKGEPASFKLAKKVKKFLKDYPFKELKELKATILDELDNLYSSEEVHNWLNQYIDTLFYLAEEWQKRYEEYKRENHLIDFSDMEKYFHELLGNSEVANEIKATYKYVFVDEFQDCSPKQVKIFDSLSEIVENSIWVGDKKQAIYGFRGSDTELTTAVMDIIAYNKKHNLDGCTTDILSNSWRSLPAIVKFTNKVYSKAFNKITPEEQEEVCLTSQRKGEGKIGFWWLTEGRKEDRAKALAANIVDMINKKEEPSDIAILARKNSDLDDVAKVLREYEVPVYIAEDDLAESETVSLVTSLLQLVDDEIAELPKAQIAFLTEPDYKLEKILDDKIDFNMNAKGEEHFYNDIPLVQKILQERDRYKLQSLPALVESLIIEIDLYNVTKKLNDADRSAKLLHAIIDSAATYEEHCELLHLPTSIMGFISFIKTNNLSISGSTEGVQLYTYHGSKGLEWKHVIILGCENDFLKDSNIIKRQILGTRLIRLAPSTKDNLYPEVRISVLPNLFSGNTNVADEWINLLTQSDWYKLLVEKEIEETKRLMYVAMTRPRDKLILALNGKGKTPKPLLAFQEMGFDLTGDYSGKACDLFNVDVLVERFPNADLEIEYDHEKEKNTVLKLAGKSKENVLPRDLQPSGMPGGKVKAEVIDCTTPITVTGKYSPDALGTCLHDIFCVADKKTDAEIESMLKAYGFENNFPKTGEIKKSWKTLTEWLAKTYGPAQKQYHELPFKHQLENGQRITGSMDFVWETSDKCVIVDYKTFPGKKEDLLNPNSDYYVGKYKGQLDCYEQALTAGGKKVIAKLLYYPVVGVVVELS